MIFSGYESGENEGEEGKVENDNKEEKKLQMTAKI